MIRILNMPYYERQYEEEIIMGKFELYAELAAISVMTDELTEKTRLITLLVEKYQYRDDIEAECIRLGMGIQLDAIRDTMLRMQERTLFIQEMLGLGE